MLYEAKRIILKNGKEAVFRSPSAADGAPMMEFMKCLSSEPPCLQSWNGSPGRTAFSSLSWITLSEMSVAEDIMKRWALSQWLSVRMRSG